MFSFSTKKFTFNASVLKLAYMFFLVVVEVVCVCVWGTPAP